MPASSALYARRRAVNKVALAISVGAAAFGLMWLVWILATLVANGISAITPALFTESTPPPPGEGGGLLNAIFGSLVMTVVGTSIVIGLFVYEIMVSSMGHFSAWAGAVALSIIAMPVVIRTTEDMLKLVPNTLREAAAALGSPQWKVVLMICYRAARNGMITGVLLAVARISGETAPLLFTALNNQFWSTDMNAPMANLPVVIFQFALSPYEDWQRLAWGGALLITVTILLLNIIARALSSLGGKQG
jgi:phosphate transport system permease protein